MIINRKKYILKDKAIKFYLKAFEVVVISVLTVAFYLLICTTIILL